jgi:PadR family transcriptional regulator, regulatory protein PadR
MARRGLGELERQVLSAILHLHGQGYAVTIADDMKVRFGKIPSLGAIYATVDRLQNKGLISSRLGSPTTERGGKSKRFYQIEASGQRALAEAREVDDRFWDQAALPGAVA